MNRFWVGIDVAKRKLDVALLDERGKVKSRVFPNDKAGVTALMRWLEERQVTAAEVHLCMESTGPYSEAPATALADAGWRVSVVNPAQPKAFAQSELLRNKTDSTDANLLARYCATMKPPLWTPLPEAYRKLRALVDRLQALKDMRQQEENRLEGLGGEAQQPALESIEQHLAWLDARMAELEKEIDKHIDDNQDTLKKDAQLLQSIPGLGRTTVAKMLGHLGDLRRFDSAKALAAFVGVTPQRVESGNKIGRSRISRVGHAYVRQALFMPAIVAARHNPLISPLSDRLRQAGHSKKSSVIAAMHKLLRLMFGVVRSGIPFDPQHRLALDGQDGI
jgi:transposase